MAAFHNSQSYGGLGNYSGQQETQKSAQVQVGLSSYGQSLSSDQLDLNNLGSLPSYQQQYSSQQYGGQSPPAPYGNQCSQQQGSGGGWSNHIDLNDPQLLQQVDQIVSSLIENKRPVLRRQVITVPASQPGRVACITRRLPTPPPDIVERITVVKPPRDVINLCIEKPVQPGPCYQERNICGKPRKPVIQPRVVQVQPRSGPPPQQSPGGPCPPAAQIQIFANGSQANSINQATSSYPQAQQSAQTLGQQPWIPVPPLQQSQGYPSQQIPSPYQQQAQSYGQPQYAPQQQPQYQQQPTGQFSVPVQQQQQGYAPQQQGYAPAPQQQPPIYDGLAQTQSQTGFVPGQQQQQGGYGGYQGQPQPQQSQVYGNYPQQGQQQGY